MEVSFLSQRSMKFFEAIPYALKPRVRRALEMLEEYNYTLGMPLSKPIGKGLFELRILGVTHIRFVYTFYDGRVVILHGFIKKTDKIAKKDLEYAQKQLKSLLQ